MNKSAAHLTHPAPDLVDLLKDAPTNWGRWGAEDEVGSLNYLTPSEVLRGVAQIRDGHVFTLQRLIGSPHGDPVWPSRTPAQREMVMDESSWDAGGDGPEAAGGWHFADDKISAFLQGSTQYDALGHVWYGGQIWNGYDARTTIGGLSKASVEPIGTRGVVGRGVLLDIARYRGKKSLDSGETFDHEDLEKSSSAQGLTIEPHDILLIRTNYLQRFFDNRGDDLYNNCGFSSFMSTSATLTCADVSVLTRCPTWSSHFRVHFSNT